MIVSRDRGKCKPRLRGVKLNGLALARTRPAVVLCDMIPRQFEELHPVFYSTSDVDVKNTMVYSRHVWWGKLLPRRSKSSTKSTGRNNGRIILHLYVTAQIGSTPSQPVQVIVSRRGLSRCEAQTTICLLAESGNRRNVEPFVGLEAGTFFEAFTPSSRKCPRRDATLRRT